MIFKSPEFHQVPLNRGKKSSSLVLPYYVPVSISTYTCDKDKIDTGYESSDPLSLINRTRSSETVDCNRIKGRGLPGDARLDAGARWLRFTRLRAHCHKFPYWVNCNGNL